MKETSQPIDRFSLIMMILLSILIALLIWGGENCGNTCFLHTFPQVRDFTWEDQKIGFEDKAFILTFDRPMDRLSVEKNLVINPPLPGKISWAGKRLAYTLETPVPYGENYELQLEGAREKSGDLIKPFVGTFNSRDRAFAYIGSQGDEQGRLILYNLTQQRKTILTPENLLVIDFKFYPQGSKILFSAAETNRGIDSLRELKLYSVTTGINNEQSAQKVELVLDNKNYQNNQFELSQDGQIIVIQRVSRQNPLDFDLWIINAETKKAQPLKIQGGEFLIAPDNQTLAVALGQGISLFALQTEAEPLDFLPKFGRILSFSPDGSAAALVNFNTDNPELLYTQSLFYVNNQGIQKEVLNIKGSILDCKFNPQGTNLYCLVTKLIEEEEYKEQPFFVQIEIKTENSLPLATLPNYQDINISMAPDGLGILFDQIITSETAQNKNLSRTNLGETIIDGRLWLLIPSPATTQEAQLEELPFAGFMPQWLP